MGSPGGSKLTYTEQRAHFALWAIIKSPLIIGADLRCVIFLAAADMSPSTAVMIKSYDLPMIR